MSDHQVESVAAQAIPARTWFNVNGAFAGTYSLCLVVIIGSEIVTP